MCTNPIIKKISFTGSTNVGKLLMEQCSGTVKRVSLELGGNAPFIVFDDADLDVAVNAAMASKFRNAGQTCVCSDRFLVHTSIENEFISKLAEAMNDRLVVGRGFDGGVTMGPLIYPRAVESLQKKLREAVLSSSSDDDAKDGGGGGAECVVGGGAMPHLGPNFFEPTLVRNVSTSSNLWKTETFGPVVAVKTFDTDDEALSIANNDRYGLASYFCTNDVGRLFRFMDGLENGMVGINEGIFSTAVAPFGGVKESGLGREGSTMGMEEYLETKYIFWNH